MLRAGDPSGQAPDDADGLGTRGADRPGRACGVDGAQGAGSEGERLAAFEEALAEIAARVEPAYSRADGWLEQTRAALVELLRFCDEQPDTARELVVESIAWGAAVLERRSALLDALAEALDRGRAETDPVVLASLPEGSPAELLGMARLETGASPPGAPTAESSGMARLETGASPPGAPTAESSGMARLETGASPPGAPTAESSGMARLQAGANTRATPAPGTAENLVGACVSLVHTRLLKAEGRSLLELAPSLMSMIAHPYLGVEAGRRELERPRTHVGREAAESESESAFAEPREAARRGSFESSH